MRMLNQSKKNSLHYSDAVALITDLNTGYFSIKREGWNNDSYVYGYIEGPDPEEVNLTLCSDGEYSKYIPTKEDLDAADWVANS